MNPLARRDGWTLVHRDNTPVFIHEGLEHEAAVHPITARTWELADGERSVAQITAELRANDDANVDDATVFEALDALADAGLLQRRAAPPAGVSRRSLLRGLAGFSAIAVTGGVSLTPKLAFAAGGDPCGDEKALAIDSKKLKKANEKAAKWLAKGAHKADKIGAPKAATEMRNKEENRKNADYRYGSDLSYDDGDVDQCGVDRITEFRLRNREERAKRHKVRFKTRLTAQEETYKKQDKKLKSKEEGHKHAYKQRTEEAKKRHKAGDFKKAKEREHKAKIQLKHSKERAVKRLQREKLYKKHEHNLKQSHEHKLKADHKQSAATQQQLNKRLERVKKHKAAGAQQESAYKKTLQKGHYEEQEKKRFKERLLLKQKAEHKRKAHFRNDEMAHKDKLRTGLKKKHGAQEQKLKASSESDFKTKA